MGLFDSIGNWTSNNIIDPARSLNRSWSLMNPGGLAGQATNPDSLVSKGIDGISGASATDKALAQQMAGATQAQGAITDAYNQSRGILSPYQQSGLQDYQNLRSGVAGGAYTPQYQQYGGAMQSAGAFNPQFQGYQGPMSSSGLQPYQGPMQSAGQFTPQYRDYQGPMTSAGQFSPQFQQYGGPMSSGNQLPQFQQFQGQAQYNAAARPERQAGTTENVNMYQDPGYQFRMQQGIGALQSSLAGRGLIGSGAEMKGILDYSQGLASQEFGAARSRFMEDQNNRQGDFESDRGFGMNNFNQNFQNAYRVNQDQNTWNAQNADRSQSWFEGDRAAGMQNTQMNNANAANLANFNQSAFEGDRAAGMTQAGNLNNYLMNRANFEQGAFEGDRAAGMGYNQFANTFNQNAFEGDRAAGLGYNQFQNNYGMNLANFQQGAFEGDRAAGMQQNQYLNNFNMQSGQNAYNMQSGLAGMGFDAAGLGANLATGYGSNLAGLYGDMANAQAQATMTQSAQRRGLFSDAFNLGGRLLGV
jgi:hypothetical protein